MSEQVTDAAETTVPCAHRASSSGGLTRRGLVAGTAGVGAACLLAACGSSSTGSGDAGSGSSDGGSSSGEGGAAASSAGVPVADVPVGGGVVVGDTDAPYVVTQPSEGTFMAFTAVCTHTGCTVGEVADSEIVCNCHGSRFDAASGEVLTGPATAPLAEMTVTQEGDSLVVS